MLIRRLPCIFTALLLAQFVRCTIPPPPPGLIPITVAEGKEAIQQLWQGAWAGHISNTLPERYRHLQNAWQDFLVEKGTDIVERYYRYVLPTNFLSGSTHMAVSTYSK